MPAQGGQLLCLKVKPTLKFPKAGMLCRQSPLEEASLWKNLFDHTPQRWVCGLIGSQIGAPEAPLPQYDPAAIALI